MRNFLKITAMVALSLVVGFGCGKSAKVNLTGLSENPAGTAADGGKGSSDNMLDGTSSNLIPVTNTNDPTAGGLTPFTTAPVGPEATEVDDTTWTDNEKGLAGAGANASTFVKDGKYWNEKVYFDYNRYEVRATERKKLDSLYDHLVANPNFLVVIEGHCDERGSDEYNRSLSERRSLSVKAYLVSLGIANERFQTLSYGEDRPAIPNAQSEHDHQMNRRAEFLIGLPYAEK